MKRQTLTLIAIACAMVVAPIATAQSEEPMRGEDNEFGSIRMPYTVTVEGQTVPIRAEIRIFNMYEEQDGRFYSFGFDAQGTQLYVTLDQIIREDTGEEVPCFQEIPNEKLYQCNVDGRSLPAEGVKIIMHGTVGAERVGTFNVGAIAMAFTATWYKIQMSSGLDAELYASTQVNVHEATKGSNGLTGSFGNFVPAPGPMAAVATIGLVALGLAALRRRRG